MPALFGPVVTNSSSIEALLHYYRAGRFSAIKVVTGWGIDQGGWCLENKQRLLATAPRVIVRTVTGDPSCSSASWFLQPDALVEEVREWAHLRPTIWIELGNEPDVLWDIQGRDENLIWVYRWWLNEAIDHLRALFPQVRLIAPSVRVGAPGWGRWLEIMADVMRKCDAISLHLYGWHSIIDDQKREYLLARPIYDQLFSGKSIAVTELGIHQPTMSSSEKLQHYRMFARAVPNSWRWVMFYHYNERADLHPEYHIPQDALALLSK